MGHFETLEKELCKELETIEQKLKSGGTMTTSELDQADKLIHSLKGLRTYLAMKEAEEDYGDHDEGNMSGYRGRAMNGRFVSRDSGGYAEGYSRGYNEARRQMEAQSGRYIPEWYTGRY